MAQRLFFWDRYIGKCISLFWKPCDLIGGSASGLWQIFAPSHTIGDVLKFSFSHCVRLASLHAKCEALLKNLKHVGFFIPALSAAWEEILHEFGDSSLPVRLNGYPVEERHFAFSFFGSKFSAAPPLILIAYLFPDRWVGAEGTFFLKSKAFS